MPKPIIVEMSFFKEKDEFLKDHRQKQKQKRDSQSTEEGGDSRDDQNTNQVENSYMKDVRISEPFVERVTEDRTALYRYMQICRKEWKETFLCYGQPFVDGVPHLYDHEQKQPVADDK